MSKRKPIVRTSAVYGYYVGDDSDGAYYQVAKGRKGWYVTVWVDGAWSGDIATDKGPWKTEQEALDWGRCEAQEWCLKNGISYEGKAEWAVPFSEAEPPATGKSQHIWAAHVWYGNA
jgi:hypothetical protein